MRVSLNWRDRIDRVASMPWDEIRIRTTQELCKRWDLALSKIGVDHTITGQKTTLSDRGRFFFRSAEIPETLECIRRTVPSVADKIVKVADDIVRHRFDLLGYEALDYGPEINWHFDAVNGKCAPKLPWYRIQYLNCDHVGDHKVIWELNRHQHLVTLAKAHRLTNDSRYADELVAQWYHWQEQNPYPIGINWASSLEVAFRSLSWLWVWQLLAGSPAIPQRFRIDVIHAVMHNARHIERYRSTYFAPNTHLLGEAVALFFIGTLAPNSRAVQRWQALGWDTILREANRQVLPDGMHFEQSTYYHVYALDFFLHARILANLNGIAVPADLDQTIENMLEALYLVSQSSVPPQFGDDDGGRVFDPRRNRIQHMLDPLAVGTVLFRRADWKALVQSPTEEVIWLLGAKAAQLFDALPQTKPAARSAALAGSGIYVMSAGSPVQQLVIDAGPQGHGWAGHGHADALSVQISIGGKPVLIDPGTFTYMCSVEEREHFRATHSHSTIQIDAVSQAQPIGSFKWVDPVHAKRERWITGDSFDFFAGSHTGYNRFSSPVIHRRVIFYLKPHFWIVRDVLDGAGLHDVDISWSFAPGSLTIISNRALFRGQDGVTLTAVSAGADEFSYERCEAWYSPRYGEKHSAPQLRASAKLRLPTECATALFSSPREKVRFERMHHDPSARNRVAVVGYRLSINETVHEIVFSDSTDHWNVGLIASDARLFYCSRNGLNSYDHCIACDVTHLRVKDERLLSAESRVEKKEWFVLADVGAVASRWF